MKTSNVIRRAAQRFFNRVVNRAFGVLKFVFVDGKFFGGKLDAVNFFRELDYGIIAALANGIDDQPNDLDCRKIASEDQTIGRADFIG